MSAVEGLEAGDWVSRRVNDGELYVVDEVREREFDARRVTWSGGVSRFQHTFRNDSGLWQRVRCENG